MNGDLLVQRGYLWVQGRGYLSVLGGYLGRWVNQVDGVGQMGGGDG